MCKYKIPKPKGFVKAMGRADIANLDSVVKLVWLIENLIAKQIHLERSYYCPAFQHLCTNSMFGTLGLY